jgi:3-methylfumaryl-CoA hydratase
VTQKQGSSGELCFVAVEHEIFSGSGLVIEERQDIVYRAAPSGILEIPIAVKPAAVTAQWQQAGRADPVMLFRYSALTFNGHRIHYDRDYATGVEHYQGLVVHGPLQATWLLDFAAKCGGVRPATFSFRGLSPLIDLDSFGLHARPVEAGLELWIETAGRRTMQAFAGY